MKAPPWTVGCHRRLSHALKWTVTVPPGGTVTLRWDARVSTTAAAVVAPRHRSSGPVRDWPATTGWPACCDGPSTTWPRCVSSSPITPRTRSSAPASPWYLTLFGRDSLWAARMMLPLGTELAAGTLRALARRQGRRLDERSGEAPGKIMHELRHGSVLGVTASRPGPVAYYGTVDATPLWISPAARGVALGHAQRRGRPAATTPAMRRSPGSALTPTATATVRPTTATPDTASPTRDGRTPADALRFPDGRTGRTAHRAVRGTGIRLPGGRRGARPARRVRTARAPTAGARTRTSWTNGSAPASGSTARTGHTPRSRWTATDARSTALTSNIGHLLGTGLLTAAESAQVAAHLTGPDLAAGFGLRTLSAGDPASVRCRTTADRSGRTTPRSSSPA